LAEIYARSRNLFYRGEGMEAGTFVGREAELGVLLSGLDDAVGGHGGLVLLTGEPGIGKSRLAAELATRARGRGIGVLWGRCWEAGGSPAYWPWIQVLRSLIRGRGPTLGERLAPRAVDLAQILPELRARFPDLSEPTTIDPESARFQLFDSVASFFLDEADDEPFVVVVEDLHAADAASVLLLRYLVGQIADRPILLLVTYRDIELTPDHPLRAALPHLERDAATVHLRIGGLTEPDVAAYVAAAAGLGDATGLVTTLHRETRGNPLFLRESPTAGGRRRRSR
jgi:predicted ATPase